MSWLFFCLFSFCLFFLLPNLLFLGRCGRGGWYDEGKDEGGERGEEFPSLERGGEVFVVEVWKRVKDTEMKRNQWEPGCPPAKHSLLLVEKGQLII